MFYLRFIVLRFPILILMFLTLLISFSPGPAEAGRSVIAVQSVRAAPFDAAFDGFSSVLAADVTVSRILLSDLPRTDIAEAIRAASPDLVLAIGIDALTRLKALENIPVVYVMVLDADVPRSGNRRVSGVTMEIDPEKQLAILMEALPGIRTIGLLYDPEQTGAVVAKLRKAAERRGVALIAGEIYRARSVPLAVLEMKGKIDLFWMLPDLTVVTPETVEFLILSAMELKTPLLTFSDKYVEQGAMMSIGVDAFDMGRQAGEMGARILAGADAASISGESARKAVVTVNQKIARKLGIVLDEKIVEQAFVIK